MANRKFSNVDNDYEVSFDQHSEITPAPEDTQIQQMNYAFKKIALIESLPADSNVDVIGVVRQVGPVNELMSRAGKQLFKRDITLVDDSNVEIKCTLWNERAQEDCSSWTNNVVAIKGCRVSDYNGKSIGTISSSSFAVNPTIPEAGHLLNWFNTGGSASQAKSLSSSGGRLWRRLAGLVQRARCDQRHQEQAARLWTEARLHHGEGHVNFIKHDTASTTRRVSSARRRSCQTWRRTFLVRSARRRTATARTGTSCRSSSWTTRAARGRRASTTRARSCSTAARRMRSASCGTRTRRRLRPRSRRRCSRSTSSDCASRPRTCRTSCG
ncbi:hypothetical protein PINS_up022469 [Pythium insidiosum]|nr:hypothetical protein PINS_up022469 [Pythium insidiosum]